MPNAKSFSPVAHGLVTTVVGPSGSGKSTLARSAVEWTLARGKKAFAFLAPAAELASYAGSDLDYDILVDEKFDSIEHVQKGAPMVSTALGTLKAKLAELDKRTDCGLLIFDTANETLSAAVRNGVLASQGIARPQETKNTWGPYNIYPLWMQDMMNRIDLLRYRKQMHVIYLWHQSMKESPGFGNMRRELVDGKLKLRWDDAMQAEVFGQAFAPQIPRFSDLFFYTEPVWETKPFHCRLVAVPDELRLPKTRLPDVMKRLQGMAEIPNDFATLLNVVEQCYSTAPSAKET